MNIVIGILSKYIQPRSQSQVSVCLYDRAMLKIKIVFIIIIIIIILILYYIYTLLLVDILHNIMLMTKRLNHAPWISIISMGVYIVAYIVTLALPKWDIFEYTCHYNTLYRSMFGASPGKTSEKIIHCELTYNTNYAYLYTEHFVKVI